VGLTTHPFFIFNFKQERKKRIMKPFDIVELLHEDIVKNLKLQPLNRGEVAKFKILQKPKAHTNTANDVLMIYPSAKYVPKNEAVFLIDKQGIPREFEVEAPEPIVFLGEMSGEIIIRGTEPHKLPLLYALRMSNYNASNIYRNDSKSAVFEEITENVNTKNTLREKQEIAAMTEYIFSKKPAEINALYKDLNLVGADTEEEKRMAMITMIESSSQGRDVFRNIGMKKSSVVREVIKKAVESEILIFNPTTKVFSNAIKTDGMTVELNPIFTVPLGQDADEALVAYFLTDPSGKKQYEKLDQLVERESKSKV
jgi:hypothetical protein